MDVKSAQYSPETDDTNFSLDRKLREHFDGKIVRKDLTKAIKEGANVPVYVLEFLLGQYCSSDDPKIIEDGVRMSRKFSPRTLCVQTKRRRCCQTTSSTTKT